MGKFKKGHNVSQEVRQKISQANKGRVLSSEHKQAIKDWAKNNPKKHQYWKGKKFSEEHIEKLKKARQGKKPMLGKKHSAETIQKFSLERKARWKNPEYKAKMILIKKMIAADSPDHFFKMAALTPKGSNSPQWRGDNIRYFGIHQWLTKTFGKANVCENKDCLKKSFQYEWAKLKHKTYQRKRENFVQLCKSCHRRYDKAINNLNINV